MIKVHKIIKNTRVEGPGLRYCIWTQGCHNRCKGCFAADTWDSNGGTACSADEIIADIRRLKDSLEGITFLGGEPFEQADGLARIARAAGDMGLGVITFTGLLYEELAGRNEPGCISLLQNTDLLIDGPYVEEKREYARPLVGSANQRFVFLSDRYSMADIMGLKNGYEVRVQKDGSVSINGMGEIEKMRQYTELLNRKRTGK